jgi:hypothetical protein
MLQGDVIMVDGLSAGPFAVWLLSLAAEGLYVIRSDLREDPMTEEGYEMGVDAMGSAHERTEALDGFQFQVSLRPFFEEDRLGLFGLLVAEEESCPDGGFHLLGNSLIETPHLPAFPTGTGYTTREDQ